MRGHWGDLLLFLCCLARPFCLCATRNTGNGSSRQSRQSLCSSRVTALSVSLDDLPCGTASTQAQQAQQLRRAVRLRAHPQRQSAQSINQAVQSVHLSGEKRRERQSTHPAPTTSSQSRRAGSIDSRDGDETNTPKQAAPGQANPTGDRRRPPLFIRILIAVARRRPPWRAHHPLRPQHCPRGR